MAPGAERFSQKDTYELREALEGHLRDKIWRRSMAQPAHARNHRGIMKTFRKNFPQKSVLPPDYLAGPSFWPSRITWSHPRVRILKVYRQRRTSLTRRGSRLAVRFSNEQMNFLFVEREAWLIHRDSRKKSQPTIIIDVTRKPLRFGALRLIARACETVSRARTRMSVPWTRWIDRLRRRSVVMGSRKNCRSDRLCDKVDG